MPVDAAVRIGARRIERPWVPIHDPARPEHVVGRAALGTREDVDHAVAEAGLAQTGWAKLGPSGRAALLTTAADRIDDVIRSEDLTDLLIAEHGKVRWEAQIDVAGAGSVLRYYASLAEELATERESAADVGPVRLVYRPLGVTAVIVPWNYPVYLAFLMLVPSLLAGNSVVVKPSEWAPLTLSRILEELADSLPTGVVSIVPGSGDVVGARLAEHDDVRGLYFTGSTATGQSIIRASAGNVKRLGLELGGNDPAIILPGAPLEDYVDELLRGTFTSSGQICYSIKRLYVHASQHDRLVELLGTAADGWTVGPGDDPRSDVGPLSNRPQYEKVTELIARTRATGARVTEHGRLGGDTESVSGYFVRPTLVTDIDNDAEVVQVEQFGPVLPIVPYSSVDEAVELANSSDYGLAASVWGQDPTTTAAVARRIDAGSVFVNAHRLGASPLEIPFGGTKLSGLGRRHGFVAVEESCELQSIVTVENHARLPGPTAVGDMAGGRAR